MLITKFTQNTERVKGSSFHSSRPWIVTALYSGVIELWDYRLHILIQTFKGHTGPVRAVQFHKRLPLICSGGDDQIVRVWNYKTMTDPFLLKGHLDYIRCVDFHGEFPWIISFTIKSSDDQTARVWNYQSRQMIAILTGHTHYVMCCQFHPDPNQTLIITCSLDKTARLWSYAPLKQKYSGNKKQDLPISGAEILLYSIITGHTDQLNSCAFHPSRNLLATASDDKTIILWQYKDQKDSKCVQDQVFKGHTGNVNSISFPSNQGDIMYSVAEDQTLKVWDLVSKSELLTHQDPQKDRFWIVVSHPENQYFACGTDSRLQVLSLYKDKIPSVLVLNDHICYSSHKQIKVIDLRNKNETALINISDLKEFVSQNKLIDNIVGLQHNTFETSRTQIMVKLQMNKTNQSKDQQYLILSFDPKNPQKWQKSSFRAQGAVFVGKSRLVRICGGGLEIFNFEQETTIDLEIKAQQVMNAGGGGKVMLVTEQNQLQIYDTIQRQVLFSTSNELVKIKDCKWSKDLITLVGNKTVIIYTKNLKKLSSWTEQIAIKSCVWVQQSEFDQDILIYSTKAHIKYGLINGENGLIKSTENINYINKVQSQGNYLYKILGLDNRAIYFEDIVCLKEAIFKQSLYNKQISQIKETLKDLKDQPGHSIVAFLYKKKFPSLAIELIQDLNTRFALAISSHNLQEAFQCSVKIKSKECYMQLAQEAKLQGNLKLVEYCQIQLNQLQQLGFTYAVNGNLEKQYQLAQKVSNIDQDVRIQCQSYNGNINDRIQLLCEIQQLPLAYLSSLTHGFANDVQEINDIISQQTPQYLNNILQSPKALVPLTPLIKTNTQQNNFNWPHNQISADQLVQLEGDNEHQKLESELNAYNEENDNLLIAPIKQKFSASPLKVQVEKAPEATENNENWGIDEDLVEPNIDNDDKVVAEDTGPLNLDFHNFHTGIPQQFLNRQSNSVCERLLINEIKAGIDLLKSQTSSQDITVLKEIAQKLLLTNQYILAQIPFLNPVANLITDQESKPLQSINLIQQIRNLLKQGYLSTTEGKFQDTLNTFGKIISTIPFLAANKSEEQQEINEIYEISQNYFLAMKCELQKKKQGISNNRLIELGVYMALFNLQPQHRILTLRSALSLTYKLKNYNTSNSIAKYLIQFIQNQPNNTTLVKPEYIPKFIQHKQKLKLQQQCEKLSTNEFQIQFQEQWFEDKQFYKKISDTSLTIIQE